MLHIFCVIIGLTALVGCKFDYPSKVRGTVEKEIVESVVVDQNSSGQVSPLGDRKVVIFCRHQSYTGCRTQSR